MTRRRILTALAASAAVAGAAAPAAAQEPPARLDGAFVLTGSVTVSHAVPREHRGETVTRTWTFTSLCAAGPCATVRLERQRGGGTDTLLLHQTAPAYYTGSGQFFVPLRCGSRVNPTGEEVPFTIQVWITGAVTSGAGTIANQIRASYVNRNRINRTQCVASLGHDAAAYRGHLVSYQSPAGS
jgi:hypothetical protein